jgi:hypothetical protein
MGTRQGNTRPALSHPHPHPATTRKRRPRRSHPNPNTKIKKNKAEKKERKAEKKERKEENQEIKRKNIDITTPATRARQRQRKRPLALCDSYSRRHNNPNSAGHFTTSGENRLHHRPTQHAAGSGLKSREPAR